MSKLLYASEQEKIQSEISQKAEEYNQARENLLRSKRAIKIITGEEAAQVFYYYPFYLDIPIYHTIHSHKMQKEAARSEVLSIVEQRRRKYLKRKNEYGDRENEVKCCCLFSL